MPAGRSPARRPALHSRAAAVGFFALLPIAVAIGVWSGAMARATTTRALLEALRHQNATAAATSTRPAKTAATPKASASKKDGKGEAKGGNQVIASKNGPITKVTGFKPTKKLTQEDTKLVENNVKQVGKNYIKAQTNLPA